VRAKVRARKHTDGPMRGRVGRASVRCVTHCGRAPFPITDTQPRGWVTSRDRILCDTARNIRICQPRSTSSESQNRRNAGTACIALECEDNDSLCPTPHRVSTQPPPPNRGHSMQHTSGHRLAPKPCAPANGSWPPRCAPPLSSQPARRRPASQFHATPPANHPTAVAIAAHMDAARQLF